MFSLQNTAIRINVLCNRVASAIVKAIYTVVIGK